MLTLQAILKARQRLGRHIHATPLTYQSALSDAVGAPLYMKLENLQKTGAFKLRGALNKLAQVHEKLPGVGVATASAGNHAQGVAWAARDLGVPALIVMPKGAAVSKVVATRSYGAEVILE